MKRSSGILLLGCMLLVTPASGYFEDAGVPTLQLYVNLGSVDAQPCESAAVTLELRDERGTAISTLEVSTEFNPLGIGGEQWDVGVPQTGSYTVTAVDQGCREGARTETSITVRVSDTEVPETIILLADGNAENWHLYYFGVIKRATGVGAFEIGQDPLRLKNVSGDPIRVCRMMLGPQVQIMELVGDEWRDGAAYKYPEDLDVIAPGQSVQLNDRGIRIVRVTPGKEDEPESPPPSPTARLLKLTVSPVPASYVYITDPPHGDSAEPFIGFCDSYFVDLGP